ncbi:MAG: transposase [Planctomycetes bacterium]|nr:transposase [Planctomycetota bacterium]
MKGPTPRRLFRYVTGCLRLRPYLVDPGDGRPQPQIPARALLWALLITRLLREPSFHGVEQLVRSSVCRALCVSAAFGDDALGYFTERLEAASTRAALLHAVRLAKRNKAFDDCGFVGLAIDGTSAGRSAQRGCELCRPFRNAEKQVSGYRHHFVAISVVGAGLSLPFDAEPYGPGDSEYAAGQRLLARAVKGLGVRFARYLVVDGEFATAPFLHAADRAGLSVVARLKGNLPELLAAVEKRFATQPPTRVYRDGKDRVEIWDAGDFDPWETLHWETVRVARYRQHKPDGSVVQAEWFTNLTTKKVGSLALYHMAKSRWEIENQGFNDAKNRYGIEHICHHQANSVLLNWLITLLAVVIERLYRIRYLHRGRHPLRSAEQLCRLLWLALSRPSAPDSS